MKNHTIRDSEFIAAFAREIGLSRRKATSLWAEWSSQLSDSERSEIEAVGAVSGEKEAIGFLVWSRVQREAAAAKAMATN